MKRLTYIDALKGLAIILVVIGHVSNGFLGSGNRSAVYVASYNFIYAFHMPLFFTISGFVFCYAYGSEKASVHSEKRRRQIKNLVFLYLVYSALLWGLKALFSGFVNHSYPLQALLLIPVKPIDLFWYLYVLIIFYTVFGCGLITRQKSPYVLLTALFLHIVSYWIPENAPFCIKRILYYALFFSTGIELCENQAFLKRRACVFLPLPVIVTLMILFWNSGKMLNSIRFVNTALGMSFSILLFSAFAQWKSLGSSRLLSQIGQYSLEIYILHTYFVTFCRAVFKTLHVTNPFINIIVASLIGVVFPIIITLICKKVGIYHLLFSPLKRTKNRGSV